MFLESNFSSLDFRFGDIRFGDTRAHCFWRKQSHCRLSKLKKIKSKRMHLGIGAKLDVTWPADKEIGRANVGAGNAKQPFRAPKQLGH